MARTPVNGLVISIASAFGATKTMSAITNATSAVATLEAAHGVVNSDILQIVTTGWPRLAGRVARVSNVATNNVTLESLNTSNTTDYPTGSGAGTVREVSTWTVVGQILNDSFASSGGEQQYNTFQYLDQDDQIEEPIGRAPGRIEFTIHDDISSAGQILLETLSSSKVVTPFSMVARTGAKWYAAGRFSMGVAPDFQGNSNVARRVSISLAVPQVTPYAT
jgi:Phage tail tube protein, TTP